MKTTGFSLSSTPSCATSKKSLFHMLLLLQCIHTLNAAIFIEWKILNTLKTPIADCGDVHIYSMCIVHCHGPNQITEQQIPLHDEWITIAHNRIIKIELKCLINISFICSFVLFRLYLLQNIINFIFTDNASEHI